MNALARAAILFLGLVAQCKAEEFFLTRIGGDFHAPIEVSLSPDPLDKRLYVAQKNGEGYTLDEGTGQKTLFLDLTAKVAYTSGEEPAFAAMVFHPDYPTNQFLYVSYPAKAPNAYGLPQLSMVVERYQNSIDGPSSPTLILAIPRTPASIYTTYTNDFTGTPTDIGIHNSGMIVADKDSMGKVSLFLSAGDTGTYCDTAGISQDLTTNWGKITRIDLNQDGMEEAVEIIACGLRNPWRFSLDSGPSGRRLLIGDVGKDHRESVKLLPLPDATPITNFGWPMKEGDICVSPQNYQNPPATCSLPSPYAPPIYVYDHGAGDKCIIGGVVYRGTRISSLRGKYIFGDWLSGRIWSLEEFGPNAWGNRKLLPITTNHKLWPVSFCFDREGEILVVDNGNESGTPILAGGIYRLSSVSAASPVWSQYDTQSEF